MPRLSVCIPAFNEAVQLPQTLECIRESFATAGETDYEVVVCDNNSTDATSQVAHSHGVRVVFEPHNQIGRARNSAAERALGEWLIFIDADTHLQPDLLKATLRLLRSGEVCGGGTTLQFDRADLSPVHRGMVALWNFVSVRFRLAAGSYIFCLRQAWEEVGGFDAKVYAGEEIFFSRRVKRWGRHRGLRFQILDETPIVTSARKLEWYGRREMLKHAFRMAWPGSHKRRESCAMWYERPGK